MNTRTLTIGIVIAVLGLVVFLQRGYFAETLLGADDSTAQALLKLDEAFAGPQELARIHSNHYKDLALSVFGGGLFAIGALLAIAGATRRAGEEYLVIHESPSDRKGPPDLSDQTPAPPITLTKTFPLEQGKAMDAAAERFLRGSQSESKS